MKNVINNEMEVISLKIPYFMKPIFSIFNNSQLLIETSICYIFFKRKLIKPEFKKSLTHNLNILLNWRESFLEIRRIIHMNWDDMPDFDCRCEINPNLMPSTFGKEAGKIIIYGLIKIFECLGILNPQISQKNPIYSKIYNDFKKNDFKKDGYQETPSSEYRGDLQHQ